MSGSFTPQDVLGTVAFAIVVLGFASGGLYLLYCACSAVRVPQLIAAGLSPEKASEQYAQEFNQALAAIDCSSGFAMYTPPPLALSRVLPPEPKAIAR